MRKLQIILAAFVIAIFAACSNDGANETPEINLSTEAEILLGSSSNLTGKITFSTNTEWAISINNNENYQWFTIDPMSGGVGNQILYITANTNSFEDDRGANITIYSKSNPSINQIFSIVQSQKDILEISTLKYRIDENGGEINVTVRTNVELDIQPSDTWIKQVGGNSSSTLYKFDLEPYAGSRSGTVTFRAKDGNLSKVIHIDQKRIGIYNVAGLRQFAAELTKPAGSRDEDILYNYGTYDDNTNQWEFLLKADVDLNPGITFNEDGTYIGGEPVEWQPIGYIMGPNGIETYDFDAIFNGGVKR